MAWIGEFVLKGSELELLSGLLGCSGFSNSNLS